MTLRLAAVAGLVLAMIATASAQSPTTKKSLDAELLEQLDNDLLDDLETLPTPDAGRADGEDIGQPGEDASPTRRIAWRMQQVKAKLAAVDAGVETQRQQQLIVDELAALIESLESRPQSGGESDSLTSGTAKRDPASASEGGDDRPPDGKPSAEPANRPSLDSSDKLRPEEVASAAAEETRRSMKQAWGNLPARWRERMLQTNIEEFLPKYQREIEQYFKQLAETPGSRPGPSSAGKGR